MLTQMKSYNKYMYYYHYVIQFVLFVLFNKSENPHFICNYIEKASQNYIMLYHKNQVELLNICWAFEIPEFQNFC